MKIFRTTATFAAVLTLFGCATQAPSPSQEGQPLIMRVNQVGSAVEVPAREAAQNGFAVRKNLDACDVWVQEGEAYQLNLGRAAMLCMAVQAAEI